MANLIPILMFYIKIYDFYTLIVKLSDVKRKKRLCIAILHMVEFQRNIIKNEIENLEKSERSCWTMVHEKQFWESDCQKNSDRFFRQNFRMSRQSFNKLVDKLHNLRRQDTNMRMAIPLDKRVAIAVYTLASSGEYHSIANMFGVGKATVGVILNDFCKEVWECLRGTFMNHFPLTRERVVECVKGFEVNGYPQCLGAIDGTHIEIHPHSKDAVDYFNYKGWYSMVLLALVDARYRFMFINVGSPGRCNDSQIFEQSRLKRFLDNCPLLEQMAKTENAEK